MLTPPMLVTYQGSQKIYGQEVLKLITVQGSQGRCVRADGQPTEWIALADLEPLPPPDYYPPLSDAEDAEWDPPLEVLVAYSSH
ncbi:MAG: hypothetical protein OHK0012_05370 [Synechococcales cyanobacterium]